LVRWAGRSPGTGRTFVVGPRSDQSNRPTDGEHAVTEQLRIEALQIIEALPTDGSTSGNLRLRERLGLDPVRYSEATASLKALDLVVAGRGRGGSLALSETGKALQAQLSGSAVQPSEPPTVPM